MKKSEGILLISTIVWCASIILAPWLTSLGGVYKIISEVIYKFYSIICHQFSSHSFYFRGYPFGVCIRCTAIYFGFLFGVIFLWKINKKSNNVHNNRILLLLISIPIIIDGVMPLIGFYTPNTFSRSITGLVFGIGLSIILYPSLIEIIFHFINKKSFGYES